MKPKFVILEYGVAEGAVNPYNYDPWSEFNQPRTPLEDDVYWYGDVPMAIRSSRHMAEILGVVNKYKKFDFEIVALQYQYAQKYLRENKDSVFVVSASVGGFFNDEFMSEFRDKFYMAISAGNEGVQGEGLGATKPYWTAIGAVTPEMKPADYSSWGKGLVSHVGIAGEEIDFEYFGSRRNFIQGTSFACPQHATQIMNLMMFIYTKYGCKPSIRDVLNLRDKYTIDIDLEMEGVGDGVDLRTGKGYYEWKDGQDYMSTITMQIGSKSINVTDQSGTKTITSPIAVQTIEGNTVLPLRVLAETLGLTVQYDSITKTITLLKV